METNQDKAAAKEDSGVTLKFPNLAVRVSTNNYYLRSAAQEALQHQTIQSTFFMNKRKSENPG